MGMLSFTAFLFSVLGIVLHNTDDIKCCGKNSGSDQISVSKDEQYIERVSDEVLRKQEKKKQILKLSNLKKNYD